LPLIQDPRQRYSSALADILLRSKAKPSIEIAAKLADALAVSLDQLVGRSDVQLDKEITTKVLTIQRLPEKDRDHILFTIDAMLRDAKARAAYG